MGRRTADAWRRVCLLFGVASVLGLASAASAEASTVTVGSPLTTGLGETNLGSSGTITAANVALAEPGAHVVSPVSGVVVRWRITGGVGGPFRIRVLRQPKEYRSRERGRAGRRLQPASRPRPLPPNFRSRAGI